MKNFIKDIRGIIFDCDGVIIDSAADMAEAVNVTLEHFGLKRIDEQTAVSFVGNGAKKLIERSLACSLETQSALEPEKIDAVLDWYVSYYAEHALERTVLYPLFAYLIERLMIKGIRMAVVSNKPQNITRDILSYFDIDEYFDAIIGPEQLKNMKPDPEGLQHALKAMNKSAGNSKHISKDETLMVGDSAVDVQAGHNFGCRTCAVTKGLGDKEKLLAEKADIIVGYAGELIYSF
ncbi:HAD-IA family hydrolase [Treponema parvum]|uniref:phosphoglycolate phosphatase n=1 Tax=Treponema parvum TaxID=138851 RepID=A0A975EXJ8_9SPIR|nr:HAD-IA family hydrolase [Treponema parvum]QTQ10865.1 HAD-IA family hydrolase [Treponema parvum]